MEQETQDALPAGSLGQCLADLNEFLNESLKACRDLTVGLSPPILKHGNMKESLCWLADWMESKHGLHVTIDADEQAHPQADEIRTLLFQAVRELLFNTVKHAGVNEASVEFKRLDDKFVQAVVRDQGAGFHPCGPAADSASGSGFGLLAIRERIHYLGGSFQIRSQPGEGTCVTLTVPVELPAAADSTPVGR